MPIIGVQGAKGGVGASLVSTNLACALAWKMGAVLIDVLPVAGGDDLLLDLSPKHGWADLLPVADELRPQQLQEAVCVHPSGLHLLASSGNKRPQPDWASFQALLKHLTPFYPWVVLDLPTFACVNVRALGWQLDLHLVVITPDPIALRAGKMWAGEGAVGGSGEAGLILNQYSIKHPARAVDLAQSIGLPLMATLPIDLRAVGFQVNFGKICLGDSQSSFGRETRRLAAQLRVQSIRKRTKYSSSRGNREIGSGT